MQLHSKKCHFSKILTKILFFCFFLCNVGPPYYKKIIGAHRKYFRTLVRITSILPLKYK